MLSLTSLLAVNSVSTSDNPISSDSDPGAQPSVEKNLDSEFQSILAQMPNKSSDYIPLEQAASLMLATDSLPIEGSFLPKAFSWLARDEQAGDQEGLVDVEHLSSENQGELTIFSTLFSSVNEQSEDGDEEPLNTVSNNEQLYKNELLTVTPMLMPQGGYIEAGPSAFFMLAEPDIQGDYSTLEQALALRDGGFDQRHLFMQRQPFMIESKATQNSFELPLQDESHGKEMLLSRSPIFDDSIAQLTTVGSTVSFNSQDGNQARDAQPWTTVASPSAEAKSNKDAPSSAVVTQLSASVYKPEWVDQFHGRVRWMVDQQISSAQVIIDPPELGPMQVDIARTADNGTQITFTVNNLAIKELLDANISRFKNMLTADQLHSVQVDVRQQHQHQQQNNGQAQGTQLEFERRYPEIEALSTPVESHFMGRPQGLLDHYV
jgi:flagellar hook-length control protein FliK